MIRRRSRSITRLQVPFPDYKPVEYTAPSVAAQPVWADVPAKIACVPEKPLCWFEIFVFCCRHSHVLSAGEVKWHEVDGKVDRRSFTGKYALDPVSRLPLCVLLRFVVLSRRFSFRPPPVDHQRGSTTEIIDGCVGAHDGRVGRNPAGRTGITGRGLLGRFGPNHAADPIVTRCVHRV